MKKAIISSLIIGLVLGVGSVAASVYAEENTDNSEAPKTSLTLKPVSKTLQISSNSSYKDSLNVTNDGTETTKVEVHASPYSYIYSEEEDTYKLGFNNENNFTQMSRWILIKDENGEYVKNPVFSIEPGKTLEIEYQINTPDNIPAGGQYAVIFVQTISDDANSGGIRTEASAGMVVYGHSTEGETVVSAEISDLEIGQGNKGEIINGNVGTGEKTNNFYGFAKVKNNGNVDFFARGELKVEPIIGFSSYQTPDNVGAQSVIPESERAIADTWTETPDFGLYKVTWSVTAGEEHESVEKLVFLVSPLAIILTIIVLTVIIILIIIGVRKRKERRSRLAV